MLAKEDDLFEKDYIRDKSIFIHTKEQDLVLNFYRFLSLGVKKNDKKKKNWDIAWLYLKPSDLCRARGGGPMSVRCTGGDFKGGKGRRILSHTNVIISKMPENKKTQKKERRKERKEKESDVNRRESGAWPDRHAYATLSSAWTRACISRPEVVCSVCVNGGAVK